MCVTKLNREKKREKKELYTKYREGKRMRHNEVVYVGKKNDSDKHLQI